VSIANKSVAPGFFGHRRVDTMREKTLASFMRRRQYRLHNPALLHTAQYGVLILD
jgi:hypothetical protein